jgi:hypothetical protein
MTSTRAFRTLLRFFRAIAERYGFLLAIMAITNGGCSSTTVINPPPGTRAYRDVHKVPIGFQNASVGDSGKKGYQSLTFVVLKSGEVVAPIRLVNRPQKNGHVYFLDVWEHGIWFVGEGQAFLELPKDDEISVFLVLLRHIGKEEWHVWELPSELAFQHDANLELPTLDGLPRLDDRKDANELIERSRAASQAARDSRR